MKLLSLLLSLVVALGSSQLQTAIAYPTAPSPTSFNLSLFTLMSTKGCKSFSDLLTTNPNVETTYQHHTGSGLTVFCPRDEAVKDYIATYHNLPAYAKNIVLLFHAVPAYYSIRMLMLNYGGVNTLAPKPGTNKYYNVSFDIVGEQLQLIPGSNSMGTFEPLILSTMLDAEPLAVYVIGEVMVPQELNGMAGNGGPAPYKAKDYKSNGVACTAALWAAAGAAALVMMNF